MTKVVLDTNVLLETPEILQNKNVHFVIPYTVLKELDELKRKKYELGFAVRLATAQILGNLHNITLDVEDSELGNSFNDERILNSAEKNGASLYTEDILMTLLAKSRGIATYNPVTAGTHDDYGYVELRVSDDMEDLVQGYFGRAPAATKGFDIELLHKYLPRIPTQNEYVILYLNDSQYSIFQLDAEEGYYTKVSFKGRKVKVNGSGPVIEAKDAQQHLALLSACNMDVPMTIIDGPVGGGKSLLALSAALYLKHNHQLQNIYITRPPIGIDSRYDVGFLPGPQPLHAKVLTPTGWTTMGEIQAGDYVMAADGSPAQVLKVLPQGKKEVFELTTTEGNTVQACGDHLWLTQTAEEKKRKKKGKIRTTNEIIETMHDSKLRKGTYTNHYLPRVKPVQFESQELPLPAYTLGALLGDGSLGLNGSVALHVADTEIAERVKDEVAPLDVELTHYGNITYIFRKSDSLSFNNHKPARRVLGHCDLTGELVETHHSIGALRLAKATLEIPRGSYDSLISKGQLLDNGVRYTFESEAHVTWTNPLKEELHKLGLLGKNSKTKFIPHIYKYASVQDRLNLLRGLMDTDGNCKTNGESSMTTISKQLALDVVELIRSLGGRATILERDRRCSKKAGFFLEANGDIRPIRAKNITYQIQVSLPEDLNPFYLKRKRERFSQKYIHQEGFISAKSVGEHEVQCIVIDHPDHLYVTDNYVVTHNSKEEKLSPWIGGVMSNLEYLFPRGAEEVFEENFKHFPVNSAQGYSIQKSVLIVDESQLLSIDVMKQIMSRVATGSKLILLGDEAQTYKVVPKAQMGFRRLKQLLPLGGVEYVKLKNIYRGALAELSLKL